MKKILTAQEMRLISSKRKANIEKGYINYEIRNIQKKIAKEASRGRNIAFVPFTLLRGDVESRLKELGYKVDYATLKDGVGLFPAIRIEW